MRPTVATGPDGRATRSDWTRGRCDQDGPTAPVSRLSSGRGAAVASLAVSTLTLAESAAVVGELRRARRKRRVASIHWVDALYQVYITGLVAVVVVVLLSGAIGDGEVSAAGHRRHQGVRTGRGGPPGRPGRVHRACARAAAAGRSPSSGPTSATSCSRRSTAASPCAARRGASSGSSLAVGAAVGAATGQLARAPAPGQPARVDRVRRRCSA